MYWKYILAATILVWSGNLVFGQIIIKGNVKDDLNNENIYGASVYISELKSGVSCDENGNFIIENIKPGNYLFEISMLGYKTKIERIQLKKDTILKILLNETVSELSELLVTSVTHATEVKRSPVIVKAIDKTFLNQGSATNIVDAMKNVPGVSQITTGASVSKPIIRGLGFNRVIVLYNGIRQEGQQWGDEHGVEIDENDIDRIEIVKGPGSLMYGSDGIAGVIHFLSPKAPIFGSINTQISTNYQSNNQLLGYSIYNSGNKNGIQWQGRFSNKYAGNYQNSIDGKVLNSGFSEYNGNLFLGINKNWGHSHLYINSFNTTINLPEGERDSTGKITFLDGNGNTQTAIDEDLKGYKIGFPHQSINHLRVSSNNFFLFNKSSLNVDLAFQNNKRREFGDILEPNLTALFFDLNTFNYSFRYNLHNKNGWESSLGIGGMYQNNTNKGVEFLIPNYHSFDIGTFVHTQKNISEKLSVAGGIRFDNRKYECKIFDIR